MNRYIRTSIATDWDEPAESVSILKRVLQKVELKVVSNPTYHPKMHLVKEWLIEFDDDAPWREIGLDQDGVPVLAGPTTVDYGFWLDTNMELTDFEGTSISQAEFEKIWKKAASVRAGSGL